MADATRDPHRRTPLWERVLLPAHGPGNLAVLRLLVGGYLAYYLWTRRGSYIEVASQLDPDVFEPVGVAAWLTAPIAPDLYAALHLASVAAAVLFTLGLCFRVSGPVCGLLTLLVLTYRQCFGFIYHTENLMAVHALVLGFAPSAHVLSLDAWLRAGLKKLRWPNALAFVCAHPPSTPIPSFRYGWPAQLIVLLTGVMYWIAGTAKIARGHVDLTWLFQGELLDHIGNNALRYEFLGAGAQAFTEQVFAAPGWLLFGLSAGSLVLELFAPLMVFPGPLRWLIGLGLFGFHWGVLGLMGIPFHYQLRGIAYAPLVRWDKLLATCASWLRRGRSGPR